MHRRALFSPDHEQFRDTVRRFIAQEITPSHAEWEEQGLVPRDLWRRAGAAGLLLPMAPAEHGGGGGDFLHTAIVVEEIAHALATGVTGFTTHSDIVAPYLVEFGTEAQKSRWLPQMATGEVVASIAMTEPSAGSDLKAIRTTARRVDGGWQLDGQKTFITNGHHADRVLVVAKTQPEAGAKGMSLFWVDTGSPVSRGAGCWTRSANARRTRPSCSSSRSSCPNPTWSARRTRPSATSCTAWCRSGS